MTKLFRNGAIALAFMGVMFIPSAKANAATVEQMLTQIQTLMAQIQELQKQLSTIKGEVRAIIREGLDEGMTGDDVTKLQELLATDPTIYPEGKVTGFFGPLTKQALKRFQARHGVNADGEVSSTTKALLEEYLHQGFGDRIPPGLLRAPGIMKKVEVGLCTGEKKHGLGPLCKMYKDSDDDDVDDDDDDDNDDADDNDSDDDDDNASTTDDFDVEVTIDGGKTTVKFTFETDPYEVVVESTSAATVLSHVADELDTTVDDLDSDLKSEITDELEDAVDEDNQAEEDAQKAIDDAQEAIDDAENEIDDASGSTTEAEDLLEDAQDKLDEAEAAFDDENFAEAEDLAEEAEDLAGEAEDAL